MKVAKVTNGVYWVSIPEEGLYVLCGCPADVVKHLKIKGFLKEKKKKGYELETGPNAILLSDASIQNGSFANLAEFPVLQMFYKQGMLLPDHPNNSGKKPLLIGLEDQVTAQSQYIYRGNYGLTSVEEIYEADVPEKQAKMMMRQKLRFAFDEIKKTEDLIEFCVIDKDAVELTGNVILHRKGFNVYEFLYAGQSAVVDLNLSPKEVYLPPFSLPSSAVNRDYFSIVHIGEGNGWDINRPCMASIIIFQGKIYLIDAGPSITFSLKALGLSMNEVEGIFHTHAHDDHFAGLTALVRSDHRIKYFATPLVRASVAKKLSSLMSFDESDFIKYFEVHDLQVDQWNNIHGLEVKPVNSPHPVETTVFYFRTFGQGGYKTYGHLADIPSFSVLENMIVENPDENGITKRYFKQLKKQLLEPVDLKKIDIGGGMIHGSAEDFANDKSKKILLSHIERELTPDENRIGQTAQFGEQDVLIPAQQDYIIEFAFDYLKRYFPGVPDYELRMLLNCQVVNFPEGASLIKAGQKNDYIYLVLTGLVEFIDPGSRTQKTLSSNSLIGEWSGLCNKKSLRTYRAASDIQCLKIPGDLYQEFVKRNGLFENLIEKHDKRYFLQSTWLFGEIVSFPTQNEIVELMEKKSFDVGEELTEKDDPTLYLLESGEIKILSEKKIIETLKPGNFFGEASILHPAANLYKAIITQPSEVFLIPGSALENVPIIQWKLLEIFERRLKIFGTQFEFEWRTAFSVNIKEIDLQHQALFKIINSLYQLLTAQMDKPAILNKLAEIQNYMARHFNYEEELMDKFGYTFFSTQKHEHEIMLKELEKFRFQYEQNDHDDAIEFLDILKEHLIVHTLIEDKKYRSFFNERGVF